ncbi:MAG: ornithine carbamoyltransferase, partial [Alphaproteobacteria bacterium]
MAEPRHFLDLDRIEKSTLREILDLGKSLKDGIALDQRPLEGRTLALIFEKASTRTRVSFEVGMWQLGGDVVVLDPAGMQLGRG